ncbi:MAG: nucleotidyltransferase domain-containing protein [Actinomycetota bacterium]
MARLTYQVVDGKASWDGRTLAEWLPDVVARIVDGFAPLQVILFGSVARGDDDPDSDIDLLVVFDKIRGRRHDAAVSVLRALRGLPVPVDIFPTDPVWIDRSGNLPGTLRVALREGKVVYEREA